jgi:hypothetical protein
LERRRGLGVAGDVHAGLIGTAGLVIADRAERRSLRSVGRDRDVTENQRPAMDFKAGLVSTLPTAFGPVGD